LQKVKIFISQQKDYIRILIDLGKNASSNFYQ